MEPEKQASELASSFTATHATIIVALIGAIGAGAGALFTSWQSLQLERTKHEAAADLQRQEFETKLIFRAIENVDTAEERTRNLRFFLDAGFISDPQERIRNLDPKRYPSKGNASFDCSQDPAPAARIICGDAELSARDKVMAAHYYKLRRSLEAQPARELYEEQKQWLVERDSCTAAPQTAVTCMVDKYDLRIVQLATRAAAAVVVPGPRTANTNPQ